MIRLTVGKRLVRAIVDDQEVTRTQGDPLRLSYAHEPLPNPTNVWFGTGYHQFKFHKLELRVWRTSQSIVPVNRGS